MRDTPGGHLEPGEMRFQMMTREVFEETGVTVDQFELLGYERITICASKPGGRGALDQDDIRICFVGDSFVQGTCDPLCLGWAGRVVGRARQAGYNLTYYNLGVRRDTSRHIADRWERECSIRLTPNCCPYIVFSFGVNDTTVENGIRRVSLKESCALFQQVVKDASARYSVAVVGPPPVNDRSQNKEIRELSASFSQIARELSVPYLSVIEKLEEDPVWMNDVAIHDGAHPGALGYAKLADLVLRWPLWWFKCS